MDVRLLLLALVFAVSIGVASAEERSMKKGQKEVFVGVIHKVPVNGVGFWQIGSHTFESDLHTQLDSHFDAIGEPINVGTCAKVELSGMRARRIEILPPHAC